MESEKIEEIGLRMFKMSGKNREDFQKCSLAKTVAKDRFEKLLQ